MYPLRALPPSTLDGLRPAPEPHASYDLDKRAVDVLLALFFSLLATPLILVAALAIVCESRRNPFFIQRRVGLLGSEFSMIKLRTMQPGAHRNIPLELNETDGPTFKAKEDPRITPVGRIIRKTSVDELPQLFNVLIGNMSLVGPRPALPREVAFYSASDAERLTVKPGITGIWQVNGRSTVPFPVWVEMDRRYIRERSLRLDLTLLARTPWAVLSMRGAW